MNSEPGGRQVRPEIVWPRNAVILQPWSDEGREAYFVKRYQTAFKEARAMRINTIVFIPPRAHNQMSCQYHGGRNIPQQQYSNEEFREAISFYRRRAIRIILYTCHYHVGHDPSWHRVIKEHPDWLLRDRQNQPLIWHGGDCWLCPNNDKTLAFTMKYTCGLITEFQPDGILLDNNFLPGGGKYCYCRNCRNKFKRYVRARYSKLEIRKRFRVTADRLDIPVRGEPLFHEWIEYRYHVVREIQRKTREAVKALKPAILFFSNSFYGMGWGPAGDTTFDFQEVVFSEGADAPRLIALSERMAQAVGGRKKPSWNYAVYWAKKGLKDPDTITALFTSIIGHQSCPWLVPFHWTSAEAQTGLRALRNCLRFYVRNIKYFLFTESCARVGLVKSRQTADHDELFHRNPLEYNPLRGTELALLECHIPFDILIDRDLTVATLRKYRTIVFCRPSCLSDDQAKALKEYVRSGGGLFITQDSGSFNERGARREKPALAGLFGTDWLRHGGSKTADYDGKCGRGRVIFSSRDFGSYYFKYQSLTDRQMLLDQVRKLTSLRFLEIADCPDFVEVNPRTRTINGRRHYLFHLFNHGLHGRLRDIRIRFSVPAGLKPKSVRVLTPQCPAGKRIAFSGLHRKLEFVVPDLTVYALVLIS